VTAIASVGSDSQSHNASHDVALPVRTAERSEPSEPLVPLRRSVILPRLGCRQVAETADSAPLGIIPARVKFGDWFFDTADSLHKSPEPTPKSHMRGMLHILGGK